MALEKTFRGDLSTAIAKQIMAAAKTADQAKKNAVDVADAFGVDPMLMFGEFFAHALGARVTSGLPRRFQSRVPNVTMKDPSYIARGQSSPFSSSVGPFRSTGSGGFKGSGGGLGGGGINPEIVTRTPFDGLIRTPRVTNTATRGTNVVVHDEKLGNFISAVSISLSSSLNTVNQKIDDTNENINVAKDGIDQTYKKLEQNSDSLEEKLDAIIEALRYSNRSADAKRDKNEATAKESFQRQQVDLSNANRILMQDMDREEIRQMQQEDLADDDRGILSAFQGDMDLEDQDELPSLAEGGIVSGPDSGYLAVLHGDEAVIPLDNNFTQGQPSAVGKEPIGNMPMMAERGIRPGDNPSTMKPTFNSSVNISPIMGGKMKIGGADDLAKAIQLPAKMAGIVTGGIMSNVLSNTILPPGVTKHIRSIISPVMEAFGVSDASTELTESADRRFVQNQKRKDVLSGGLGKQAREKGILTKIKEFLFGGGGGNMTYRGTGGNTYVNNRTSGVGGKMYGTGGFFGGKKKEKTYKSKQDFGAILRATAMKDATMVINGFGDPERFKKKYGITAEQFLALPDYPTDQSSLNSDVFTKSVAYENAYDYRKFESPEYGLKTSNIAYNMSMDDEINGIVDGLTNPDNQVIMNNQAANSNVDNQIEYSAIKFKGNPLKAGTYISPYSV